MDLSIVTLIFFALAVIVFIQLRSVLGRRIGHEREPFDPYTKAEKTVTNDDTELENSQEAEENRDPYAEIDAYATINKVLNTDLKTIKDADASFSVREFLNGAKAAYEMILTAFANGNRDDLKNLLADNIYQDFATALNERSKAGETVKFSFVSIDKADILTASLTEGTAQISVSFHSEIISATYDKDGVLIDGDEKNVIILKDRWTFSRDVASQSPDWLLIATEDEE